MDKTIAFDGDSSSDERVEIPTVRPKNPGKGVDPVEQAFVDRLNLLRTAEVESFLKVASAPLRLVEPNPNSPWANMDFESLFKVSSRTDWTDADMMNRPGVTLELLNNRQVVELGRNVLNVLTSQRQSQQSVAGVLVLAWNLRCPTTLLPMFPKDDPTATGKDVPISQFSDPMGVSLMYTSGASVLQTWRYARVFDPQYFSELQTKNCSSLVYILATLVYAMTNAQDSNAGNIFKIKQLENVSYIDKYMSTSVAFKAYLDPNNSGGQNYWKLS